LCGGAFKDCDFPLKYFNVLNMNRGFVHRLITIGTPHEGSPLANALFNNRNKLCWNFRRFGPLFEETSTLSISGGAVEDLATTSGAIAALKVAGDPPFAVHHIIGTATSADETAMNNTMVKQVRRCGSILPEDIRTLFGGDSDLVVSATSQRRGLASGANNTVDVSGVVHSDEMRDRTGAQSDAELDSATIQNEVRVALGAAPQN
jgi:hypothetical protein